MVSFSGGKDSTAMLLRMIEDGMPIDGIVYCDTGLEFPQMYEHIAKVERETGYPIIRLKGERAFEYLMLDCPVNRKSDSQIARKYGADQTGYGWPGPRLRWCTKELKETPRRRFEKTIKKSCQIRHYIGIAADETKRLERKNNRDPTHVHPLVDWGMTEQDCLEYCYSRDYDWGGLYRIFRRVSCWCCPLQSLEELRMLRKYFPDLWEQLGEWDRNNYRSFRPDYSVRDLDKRFLFEEERLSEGKPVKGKEFMAELRKRLCMGGEKTEDQKSG